jgi:hypothetical protein
MKPFLNIVILLATMMIAPVCRAATPQVYIARTASFNETLAAREVMRYLYLRTGSLVKISKTDGDLRNDAILIARKGRSLVNAATVDAKTRSQIHALGPQQYILKTLPGRRGRKTLLLVGGDDTGTLYAAYRFAEKLGVRFYLHGDVIPDQKIPASLPDLNEVGKPLFSQRGIQPFHDFPEGPDWWNSDDYLAYISQLPKLRMNFIGLHCYPEGTAGPEPAVWIGQRNDMDKNGRVSFSYPSRWANTAIRVRWGYEGLKTSDFTGGASLLFPQEHYGPDVMDGMLPNPKSVENSNRLFNNVADLFRTSFSHARSLGVKVAIGTETPLIIPKPLRDRLLQQGKNPDDPNVVREIYRGIFERIARAYPIDYYWLWTPESWIWGGNKPGQFEATAQDIQLALDALKASGSPFTLATSGWVLGPQHDRAALDSILPKDSPISSINQYHSFAAVDAAFANIAGRPKWAIPWLENDKSMTTPQFWVGRLRFDAADTLRMGGTGLIGIHWRTKAIAPNISALAAAAWDQSYVPDDFDTSPVKPRSVPIIGAVGGENVLGTEPVAGTPLSIIYQSLRYKMQGYNLKVPNGTYKVTLQLSEPTYNAPGQRVFGVKMQGHQVLEKLDIFARVGKLRALDIDVPNVRVDDGLLKIEFTRQVEYPVLGGIIIEGTKDATPSSPAAAFVRKINAAGGAYAGFEPERPKEAPEEEQFRTMPVEDFYIDFARANFGENVASEAGQILAKIDGMNMPFPSDWIQGPGGVRIDQTPLPEIVARYHFIEDLADLRPQLRDAGNIQRFDYWLTTFRYAFSMAKVGSLRAQLDKTMLALKAEPDRAKQKQLANEALTLRIALARGWERMMSLQVSATDTPGELGTLANLEQHSRKWLKLLSFRDEALAAALGSPLPSSVEPAKHYAGPARIIVPTVRSMIYPGEKLTLKVILLSSENELPKGTLFWRPLGRGKFAPVPLTHVAQRVYRVSLPPLAYGTDAIEYYIQATYKKLKLVYPATAPNLPQTVVVAQK